MAPRSVLALSLFLLVAPLDAQNRSDSDATALALPAPGERTLRILSPTVLEVTVITEKIPDSRMTKIKNAFGGGLASPEQALDKLRVTVNGGPVKIDATGWKRRAAYAPLARRDLRVSTSLYLRLATPIDLSGAPPTVVVHDPSGALGEGSEKSALTVSADPRRLSPAIHVNQEGYVPTFPKKAMVGYFLGELGELSIATRTGFALIDARDGREVFRGALAPRPDVGLNMTPLPYQQVFMADFGAYATPGEYRLAVDGLGASLPFLIDDGVAMGFARTYALGLYGQRCGCEQAAPFTRFVHGACHLAPAQVPSPQSDEFAFTWSKIAAYASRPSPDGPPQLAPRLTSEAAQLFPFARKGAVDVSGGHHDAGDYSKYTINSAGLVHYLVFTLDNVPGAAGLDNLGLPESGDGVPDVLQEAKWEADFLARMQDEDGGFYFLVYPKTREYEANVLPEHGDAQVVWPKNTTVTAAAVAALAQCASSPSFQKHYPKDAARYLRQARLGWDFLNAAIAKHGKDGAYQKITFYGDHYTHNDELAWAACELFLATGEPVFHDHLLEWFPNPADPRTFRWGWWRMSEAWGNAIRSYVFATSNGRQPKEKLDARYLVVCEKEVAAAGDDVLAWSEAHAYGSPFPLPTKKFRGGGWYFSLDQAADLAVASLLVSRIRPAHLDALVGAMNYEGGTNPSNMPFLTGLGARRQREVVSQYAQNDRRVLPPPGIPIGNILAGYSYSHVYGTELRELTHPRDDAETGAFPIYDRWSDAFNVTGEYIAMNQARGFLSSLVLAMRTESHARPWKPVPATIVSEPAGGLQVVVDGENLAGARILWEAAGREPAYGRTFDVKPAPAAQEGGRWVEVEVVWPDGRRAFATRLLR